MDGSRNLSDQYLLTIKEASKYFRIGEGKMRRLVANNRDASWVLWNNSRALIKRKLFEQVLDNANAI